MGEVYRARDARLKREVAVKILPPEVAADPARRQRFEFEARTVAALNHPNIVAIYDVGAEDGVSYIVSELIEGQPLRGSALGLRKSLDCAVQIANGIAAAHAAGIVHRDLKPDNIMLTRDGRVKILDFGLARLNVPPTAAAATETLTIRTEPGLVMGTVGYMSPEQVRGKEADERSDIFSFGVILYEMLSGRRAFHGDTAVETMTAILKQELPESARIPCLPVCGRSFTTAWRKIPLTGFSRRATCRSRCRRCRQGRARAALPRSCPDRRAGAAGRWRPPGRCR